MPFLCPCVPHVSLHLCAHACIGAHVMFMLSVPDSTNPLAFVLLAPCFGNMFSIFIQYSSNGKSSVRHAQIHKHMHIHPHKHRGMWANAHICIHTLKQSSSLCRWSSEIKCPLLNWPQASKPHFYIRMSKLFFSATHLENPSRISACQWVSLPVGQSVEACIS